MNRDIKYIILICFSLFLMLFLDFLWLEYIVSDIFNSELKNISGFEKGNFEIRSELASIIYFLVGLILIFFFDPAIRENFKSIFLGVLVGILVFSTIQFTNYIFFNNYSFVVVILDIIWGCFLFGFISYLINLCIQKFFEIKE